MTRTPEGGLVARVADQIPGLPRRLDSRRLSNVEFTRATSHYG